MAYIKMVVLFLLLIFDTWVQAGGIDPKDYRTQLHSSSNDRFLLLNGRWWLPFDQPRLWGPPAAPAMPPRYALTWVRVPGSDSCAHGLVKPAWGYAWFPTVCGVICARLSPCARRAAAWAAYGGAGWSVDPNNGTGGVARRGYECWRTRFHGSD